MNYTHAVSGVLLLFLLTLSLAAQSHEGHAEEAPVLPISIAPRVEATSDVFELVAVVEAEGLRLYLDRFDTNEPVTQATIEVDWNGSSAIAKPLADGSYRLEANWHQLPGEKALGFTVTAGEEMDLLAGVLPPPSAESVIAASQDTHARTFRPLWILAFIGVLGAIFAAYRAGRKSRVSTEVNA